MTGFTSNGSHNGNNSASITEARAGSGVRDWEDKHGNYGFELYSLVESQVSLVQARRVFHYPASNARAPGQLSSYFGKPGQKARKVCAIIDERLDGTEAAQVEGYLAWCRSEKLIQDFSITQLLVQTPTDKSLNHVYTVVGAAEKLSLRRRDLLLAVGGAEIIEVVGFAAGTYRRATPWISVATNIGAAARWARRDFHVAIHCQSRADDVDPGSRGLLGFVHAPVAAFVDLDAVNGGGGLVQQEQEIADVEQHMVAEKIQYHVAEMPGLLEAGNRALIESCCPPLAAMTATKFERKALLVVEADLGRQALEAAEGYFRHYTEAGAETVQTLSMHVTSAGKDMQAVLRVIEAAAQMGMTASDLFVVIAGGTLMDVVGMAAALYRGGTPYVRVPTTLVGMIDAGIGVKVGVNFGSHKNFLGRYYAPVACLNDAAAFLPSLPRREYGCGLAEALKMACITSPRLFDLIESHQTDRALNPYSYEVILLAVRTMLEELAPNIYEHSLIRLVDFGHEFGHIIESLAQFTLPHGEAVGIGMAISSFLAYLIGVLSRRDLVRILDCILSLGLPIWSPHHDCCDPAVLWDKISSDGIEHKDGMLYLAVPKAVGQGGFIDNLSAIDADMLTRAIRGLQIYSGSHLLPSEATTSASSPVTLPSERDSVPSPSGSQQSLATELEIEDFVSLKAAVLGAPGGGNVDSTLVQYLLDRGAKVIWVVQPDPQEPHEYHHQRLLTLDHPNLHRIIGYSMDPAVLTTVIRDADVIYNMAAMVSPSSAPADPECVVGLNGFGQGVISYMLKVLGRQNLVKVVCLLSQSDDDPSLEQQDIDIWISAAEQAFNKWSHQTLLPTVKQQSPLDERDFDIALALQKFASSFIAANPLPLSMVNVCKLAKRLGTQLVSLAPRLVLVRVSEVYGPTITSGFVSRTIKPKNKKSSETAELKDFIYVDDLNKILLRLAFVQPPSVAFDCASGQSTDLRSVWRQAREIIGDGAQVEFKERLEPVVAKLDTRFSQELLERDFVSFEEGLRRTIDGRVRQVSGTELAKFILLETADLPPSPPKISISLPTLLRSAAASRVSTDSMLRFHCRAGAGSHFTITNSDSMTFESRTGSLMLGNTIKHALSLWYKQLSLPLQVKVQRFLYSAGGLLVQQRRLQQLADFNIETKEQQGEYQISINIDHGLAVSFIGPEKKKFEHVVRNLVGRAGYHVLAFISRQFRPVLPQWAHQQEQDMARSWSAFLTPWLTPPVLVLDIGSTTMRTAIFGPHGELIGSPSCMPSPSRHLYPQASLAELQGNLINTIVRNIETLLLAAHPDLLLQHVAIGFGAVIDRHGLVHDASIFWGEPSKGYDLRAALQARLPAMNLSIVNDISAAAWRFHEEQRFCLITASSGLSNKVFDRSMSSCRSDVSEPDRLILNRDGLGGEMGHVVVEPRLVDEVVAYSQAEAARHPVDFSHSRLSAYKATGGDPTRITAQILGRAAVKGDMFARRLLDDKEVPYCPCGTLADLCSYGSGRAALARARKLAPSYNIDPAVVTDMWLQRAMAEDHPLAIKVLREATCSLALRILQLAADTGLEKFVLVGGFALKTARGRYLPAVQNHLARLCTYTGFFAGWSEDRVRGLVQIGADDDNDVLLGLGHYVHHVKSRHYRAVVKPVGENNSLTLETRELSSRIGDHQVLAKVIYAGICSTDLQILRGERGLEPVVPGHEGVCQVVMVGSHVHGLTKGDMLVLLPNNPLDDSEKLGHNREGLLQEYITFGQELIDRGQLLPLRQQRQDDDDNALLSMSSVSPTMTLIEPLSCVVAATEDLITPGHITGKNVLVVGAGTLGLLFVTTISKLMSPNNVFLASRSAESLEFAVTNGIVGREKTIAVGGATDDDGTTNTAWIDKLLCGVAAAGEQGGINTVIICVSLGQGASVADKALRLVNDGGFVHLFGGFCSGDILNPGSSWNKVDVLPIRAEWKREVVEVWTKTGPEGPMANNNNKRVTLSGNRGSRKQHVARAAQLLEDHGSEFARVISHLVLLGAAPEVMCELAQSGRVGGAMAKRVVVDMSGSAAGAADSHKAVQTADEVAMNQLRHAAACRQRDMVPAGNRFRDLAWDRHDDQLVLGWVARPSWEMVRASAQRIVQVRAIGRREVEHVVWVGTGPWAFWIELLRSTMPAQNPGTTFHSLSSLDPHALAAVLADVGRDSGSLGRVLCIGTSQSGTTIETAAIMNALRLHFDAAGLDYRDHFVWLTDRGASVYDTASGEAVIRHMASPDWADVDVIPLALVGQAPINALFATPYSSFVMLSFILGFSGAQRSIDGLRQRYDEYAANSDSVANSLLVAAAPLMAHSSFSGSLRFVLPDSMATNPGLERLVVQLLEQALACKSPGLCPRVRVAAASSAAVNNDRLQQAGFTTIDLSKVLPAAGAPSSSSSLDLVSALVLLNALNHLCATIAYRTGSPFVTHPKVNLYKQRALDILAMAKPLKHERKQEADNHCDHDPVQAIVTVALTYLATYPHIRFIDLLPYGHAALQLAKKVEGTIAANLVGKEEGQSSFLSQQRVQGTSSLGIINTMVRTVPGESWNHSEFPSAIHQQQQAMQLSSSLRGRQNDGQCDANHKNDTLRIFILPELSPSAPPPSGTTKQSSSSSVPNPAMTTTTTIKSDIELDIVNQTLANNMRTLAAIGLATSEVLAEVVLVGTGHCNDSNSVSDVMRFYVPHSLEHF